VVVSDVDAPGAERVAAAMGGMAEAAALDVRDGAAFEAVVEGVCARHGGLDLLVNNAGIAVLGEALHHTAADWDRLVSVNLMGVVHGVQAAYPRMARRRSGRILNIASVAGLCATPGLAAYSATKHAVVGLSLGLRAEAAAYGVGVSVACPGFVDTPLKEHAEVRALDRQGLLASLPVALYPVDACARRILRGAQRDRAVIVVAPHAHLLYALHRFAPPVSRWLARVAMARIRRVRTGVAPA
jgi:NAD(P)-dependent dehydrogenase (short-subunit alcohol dehydrogenase family)